MTKTLSEKFAQFFYAWPDEINTRLFKGMADIAQEHYANSAQPAGMTSDVTPILSGFTIAGKPYALALVLETSAPVEEKPIVVEKMIAESKTIYARTALAKTEETA